jgi:hypothetical protein
MCPFRGGAVVAAFVVLLLVAAWCASAQSSGEAPGQPPVATDDGESTDATATVDTEGVDTEGTLDEEIGRRGLQLEGDLRMLIDNLEVEERDGTITEEEALAARLRLGVDWGALENLHFGARLAGLCSTERCDGEWVLQSSSPTSSGLGGGQITLDQAYVHWLARGRFDLAAGRLQSRFVLRGGVFARSLDRNDSNNVTVTWTDGIHASYRGEGGWSSHVILQHNSDEGSGSVRRQPLDFGASAARQTYFVAFESLEGRGPVVQRGFDVSYLPSSLLVDGDMSGPRESYVGLVGRVMMRWPQRSSGPRLRAGAELGYAPERPTASAVGLAGDGRVDGLAWDATVSFMDFVPDHSIGVNYARTEAGWLLSPQFRPNEELAELRWRWRRRVDRLLEARVRWREDLHVVDGAERRRNVFDFFVRATWQLRLMDYGP